MTSQMISIIALLIVAIVTVLIAVFSVIYDLSLRKKTLSKADEDEWLLKGFQDKLYDLIYGKAKSDTICGINKYEYDRYCKILHKPNNFRFVVACRIEAILMAMVCFYLGVAMKDNTVLLLVFLFIGFTSCYFLWVVPYSDVKRKVENKLFTIENDLPRFLSLLEKAMSLPINQAIRVTAVRFESPLSDDLIDSLNRVTLGANGWEETLMDLAKIYDLEDFNDLVLEIVNSYEQGVNIRPLVNRKVYEVEQNRMYAVESHDSKIKTLIFMPIIFLKVVPLMVMIAMPMLGDFM